MSIKSCEKVANIFNCENCDYNTSRKSSYTKHILSAKHEKSIKSIKSCKKVATQYLCILCNKNYKEPSGLWRHNKKCKLTNTPDDKHLICKVIEQNTALISQNQEFKELIVEQNKTITKLAEKTGNSITNSTVNSHNKFNLNVYLNETCKNALNISDFVSSLVVSVNDLEETARLGYAEGISQIFLNGLKQIDVHNRPLHCADNKREVLYIRDNNEWTKDTDDKATLTKAIKTVAHKNIKQISEWQKQNPEYNDPDSKQNDKYQKILCNAMSGSSKEESDKNYEKIIKNVVKQTIIEKQSNNLT
jgi:hypothetical protein